MPIPPPEGSARITPYLVYDDPAAAIDWLDKAFGFQTKVRVEDGAGNIVHCELEYGGGVVGIGGPSDAARSPKAIGGQYTQNLYTFVNEDIKAHYERAQAAGAEVFRELADQEYGDRVYGCRDPEGHKWFFGFRYDQKAWDDSTP